MNGRYSYSWGRWPRHRHSVVSPASRFEALPASSAMLPWGNGRSYGDVCQNAGGTLIASRGLDRFIEFDPVSGLLSCEAGVLLDEITAQVLPRGWMLPVVPGTAFVTVGGAIANDVHGKNHHTAGSFGHHVLELDLLRSDGTLIRCSPGASADLFCATVGGLGLTGFIRRFSCAACRDPGSVVTANDSEASASSCTFRTRPAPDSSTSSLGSIVPHQATHSGAVSFSAATISGPMRASPGGVHGDFPSRLPCHW
jgi:FAD/FMN-containing dehydrogenase